MFDRHDPLSQKQIGGYQARQRCPKPDELPLVLHVKDTRRFFSNLSGNMSLCSRFLTSDFDESIDFSPVQPFCCMSLIRIVRGPTDDG